MYARGPGGRGGGYFPGKRVAGVTLLIFYEKRHDSFKRVATSRGESRAGKPGRGPGWRGGGYFPGKRVAGVTLLIFLFKMPRLV